MSIPLPTSARADAPSRRTTVLILGAALPPPYGGIARYLDHAVRHLIKVGFKVIALEGSLSGPGAVDVRARTSENLEVRTRHLAGILRALLYGLSRPRLLLRLLWWYLPPLTAQPLHAGRRIYSVLSWMLVGEAAMRRERVGIVHAYDFPWDQGAAAVLLARQFGARSVLSTFGEVVPHCSELEPFDRIGQPYRWTTRHVVQAADQVVSMTDHCRMQLAAVGVDPARIRKVRLVVGMGDFSPAVTAGGVRRAHQGRIRLLLFVGQIRPRKGPQILVSSLPELLVDHPNCRAVFVGPDEGYQEQLRVLAARLGVAHAIELVGAVSDADLPAYYAACDVFVFPSLTSIECLGLTFVQAMFAARPVVASALGGTREVIRDGIDGVLVKPGDVHDLAVKLGQVLDWPEAQREDLGQTGRRRVLTLFDESEILEELVSTYERLLL